MITSKPTCFDEYIIQFPEDAKQLIKEVRDIIKNTVPNAVESISYGMPAYKTYGKPLIYFACFKNHIGLYATPSGHQEFKEELSGYKQGKGSVQFPLDQPIPYKLIMKIAAFKATENELKYNKTIQQSPLKKTLLNSK